MKILATQTGTSEASFTKRIITTDGERISSIDNTLEEMDTSVKQNVKSKIFLAQNF